jgi:ribonucleoside-diphosphate reductase alpha chain
MDHPEIESFITWKAREERKVAALIKGGYSSDFNGEAYKTVGGQNSNNSVRVNDQFMHAVENDGDWNTTARTTGEVIQTYKARDLWKKLSQAAWQCADPGVQYDTTINDWHTCASTDRINASNPCSEYMFLDDTACNLASLNLVKFLNEDGSFNTQAYQNACRVFITAQEILVDASSYPTQRIAQRSHDFRTLGLGYANLGTMLMLKGIAYDSDEGRAWAGALTSIMCGAAYKGSAEIASKMGPFPGYKVNEKPMLKVIEKHKAAALEIDAKLIPKELFTAAQVDWAEALKLGQKYGYRNAQVTVLAPTGTIGLLMDCDTTGVEPDFSLVKFKKLAGGGYFKIVNGSVPQALKNLGYPKEEVDAIIRYLLGSMSFEGSPHLNRELLKSKGLLEVEIDKIEKTLAGTFEISSAFAWFTMGEATLKRIGLTEAEYKHPAFNFLTWAGLSQQQLDEVNEFICGTMTVEGAPFLKDEHLSVFDCANKCGAKGERFIKPMGHIRMMAAVQPFLSGAISKTVNVPQETTVEEVADIYMQGWKLGLKAVALYRDGSKLSQVLNSKSEKTDDDQNKATDMLAGKKSGEKSAAQKQAEPAQMTFAPIRRKLPNKRTGFTQEAGIAGHKIYLRTGEYEDGTVGEIFIDMHKEGAAYRSMMNCFAISVSLGLQYGVPLKEFVDKFTFTRFEPAGLVDGHPNIKFATSMVDYIFRVLGLEYLGRTDFVQVKPVLDSQTAPPTNTADLMKSGAPVPGVNYQLEIFEGAPKTAESNMSSHLADMMGDAPPCESCGHTTVRNGSCYKCLNCGNSMGCS